ncbi:LysR family transcriptional regulator [Shimia sediminis]|uniref:LysR family transcriptional regulator n=1 Tax=Shimia sediminis TaxID=2497945 RepID=UPI000F8DEB6B|nr:LysR family transcriptional regulator [Shimia sediminis]
MRSLVSQLTLHKLEVFCHVAELESVSRAAEACRIAQPVVTTHIKSLSEKLGVQLTQRNGRRITLTEDGKRIYVWAKEIVSQTRELEQELKDRKSGKIGNASIAASMTLGSYILPSIVSRFKQSHEQSNISVQVASPKLASEQVLSGDCDFGLTIIDQIHGVGGLNVTPLYKERLILAGSEKTTFVGDHVTPEKLVNLPFVTAKTDSARRDLEDYALMTHGLTRSNVALELGHGEAIKRAVRAGAGIAFLFKSSVMDELEMGTLREIRTPGMSLAFPIYLVQRQNRLLSAFQKKLIDYICSEIRDLNQDELLP